MKYFHMIFSKNPYEYDLIFFVISEMDGNGFEFENVIIKSEDKSLSEEDPEMVGNILIVKKEEEKLNEADFKDFKWRFF